MLVKVFFDVFLAADGFEYMNYAFHFMKSNQ